MTSLFLSHSSKDKEFAQSLHTWLRDYRYEVFLDFDGKAGIPGGSDWERELYLNLRASDAVIAVRSEAYLASAWCFAEIAQARALNKTIIPLNIDGFRGDGLQADSVAGRLARAMENLLADRQSVDFTSAGADKYDRLKNSLRAAGLDPLNSFPWIVSRPPYPGLHVYESDDAAVFFGRSEEIHSVLGLLAASRTKHSPRLIVVTGPSGSGKSSLVRAGVVPRLGNQQWHVLPPFTPGRSPVASLARSFAAYRAHNYTAPDSRMLLELLRRDSEAGARVLIDLVEPVAASARGQAAVLLVVDQWEELFGPASEEAERDRAAFHAVLRRVVEVPDSPLVILATLRSDYFEAFQKHKDWVGLARKERETFILDPMPAERFSQVVEGPTARGRLTFEPGLVTRLVQDAKNADALPLLAFALRALYERRDADGRMTLPAYEQQVKGINGALMHAVNEAIGGDLTPEAEAALRRAFVIHLARIDPSGPDVRWPARWDDLPFEARPLLERFVTARLLTTQTDDDGQRTVEVVHETLFRAWDRLAGWLSENRALRLWRDRIKGELTEWQSAPKRQRPQFLLGGPRVAEARHWLKSSADYFPANECAYLQESVAAENHRLRLRWFWGFAALLLFLIVIAGGLYALNANHQRQLEARHHRQTRLAKTRLLQDASLDRARRGELGTSAVLLGHALVEAEGQDADLESALRSSITLARGRLLPLQCILAVSGNIRGCAIAPDGHLAVVGTDKCGVHFVDPGSGKLTSIPGTSFYRTSQRPVTEAVIDEADGVTGVAFELAGPRFAISTNGGKIHVVDSRTGAAHIFSHPGRPMSVCFSPDGSELLVAAFLDADRHVNPIALALYDTNTGAVRRHFRVEYDLYAAAISSDGRWVAAGGGMPPHPRLSVWDSAAPEAPGHELPQSARVFCLAFRPGHPDEFVTGDVNGTVQFWHLRRENVKPGDRAVEKWESFGEITHDKQVRIVAFSEDGRLLLVGGEDGSARLWDAESRSPVGQRLEHRGKIYAGAVSVRAGRVIVGDYAGDIRVFDLRAAAASEVVLRHPSPVWAATFNATGDRVLTGFASSRDHPGGGRVWKVTGGPPIELAHGADVLAALFQPHATERAITCGNDGSVAYWNTRTGKQLGALQSANGRIVYSAAFNPAGDRVAFAGAGGVIHVCEFDQAVGSFRPGFRRKHPGFTYIWNLRFLPDGRLLSDGGRGIRVWSSQNGIEKPLAEMPPAESKHAGPTADQKLGAIDQNACRVVALGDDGEVAVWDLANPQVSPRRLGEVPHGSGQLCADWHGASDVIATGGPDGIVRLWRPDGTPLAADLIHPSPVEVVAFSPDGQWLATGGRDGFMRLWKVAGGTWTGAAWYHAGPVTRVRFSPDGRYLLSASRDGTARVVAVPVEIDGKPDSVLSELQADAGILVEIKGTGATSAATAPRPLTAQEYRALRGTP